MADRRSAVPTVTVATGPESVRVTGRAAAIFALIAAHAERISGTAVGKLIANVAPHRVKLELTECLPAVRLDR